VEPDIVALTGVEIVELRILRDKCYATGAQHAKRLGSGPHVKNLTLLVGFNAFAPQSPTAAAWHHLTQPSGCDALAVVRLF
jgi:hypothetical protein